MKFIKSDFYFQKMKEFFLKKGKKEIIEKNFYNYLLNRSKKKKIQFNNFINRCYYRTLFIVKYENKKKKLTSKNSFSILKNRQKRGLNLLSKLVSLSAKSGKSFENLFEKELNLILKKRSSISLERKKNFKLLKSSIFSRKSHIYFKPYKFWLNKSRLNLRSF